MGKGLPGGRPAAVPGPTPVERFDPCASVPGLAGKHALRSDLPVPGKRCTWSTEDIEDELVRYDAWSKEEIPYDERSRTAIVVAREVLRGELVLRVREERERGARERLRTQGAVTLGQVIDDAALPDDLHFAALDWLTDTGRLARVEVGLQGHTGMIETLGEVRKLRLAGTIWMRGEYLYSGKSCGSAESVRTPAGDLARYVVMLATP